MVFKECMKILSMEQLQFDGHSDNHYCYFLSNSQKQPRNNFCASYNTFHS